MMYYTLFYILILIVWFYTIHQSLHIQCFELSLIFKEYSIILIVKCLAMYSF